MRLNSTIPVVAVALLLVTSPLTLADVLVVDADDPNAAHGTIQGAVHAAVDGDTILIRAPRDPEHRFAGFTIDGKALTVRGEGRPFLLTGPVTIRNLATSHEVLLDGLSMNLSTLPNIGQLSPPALGHSVYRLEVADVSGPGLLVTSSQGAVRVQNCAMQGSVGERVWAGLQLALAGDVALIDCTVYGTYAAEAFASGGTAAQVVSSRIAAYGTLFEGGAATFANSHGGTGMSLLQRSVAWLDDCTVRGGEGARTYCASYPCQSISGDGGDGLVVQTGSVCHETASEFAGGPGGLIEVGSAGHASGSPGEDGTATVGTVRSDPATHVEFGIHATQLAAGSPASLAVTGTPGETVRIAVARGGGFRFLGTSRGAMGVSKFTSTVGFEPLGVIPASGVLESSVPLPPPGSEEDAATLYLQVVVDSATSFRLSALRAVTIDGADVPSTSNRRIVRVDASAAPGGDGTSWSNAFATLDDGLRALPWEPAGDHVELWIRAGTYRPLTLTGPLVGHRCRVIGGFDGTEPSADAADPVANPTIFDGDRFGDGTDASSFADNAASFLTYGSFTLNEPSQGSTCEGLRLRSAFQHGGQGAVVVFGDTTIERCWFERNFTPAVLHFEGDLRVNRSRFVEQQAHYAGSSIESKYREIYDGGVPGSIEVVSCVFLGNRSTHFATIRAEKRDSVRIVGSTFHGNGAWIDPVGSQAPGAVMLKDTGPSEIVGCILSESSELAWTSYPSPSLQIGIRNSTLELNFNCIADLDLAWPGVGNVASLPGFVDPMGPNGVSGDADDDLRLAPMSPCIDAGDSLAFGPGDTLDVTGRPRLSDDPAAPDTGTGDAPVADIGAHER